MYLILSQMFSLFLILSLIPLLTLVLSHYRDTKRPALLLLSLGLKRAVLRPLPLFVLPIVLMGASCDTGDIGSSTTVNDDSVDNSQHGISQCGQGTSFVCTPSGPDTFVQTEECTNVNGQPVVLNGPDPIDASLVEACPRPTPTPIPEVVLE